MVFLSFLAGVLGVLGTAGAYYRILSPSLGFYLALGALAFIALHLPYNLFRFITRGKRWVYPAGFLFGLLASVALGFVLKFAIENPITDVTNLPANPPPFRHPTTLIPVPSGMEHFLDPSLQLTRDYDPSFTEKQARAYPNIYILELAAPESSAFTLVSSLIARHPEWRKVSEEKAIFNIEMEEELPVFRSVDDFLVRIAPANGGSQVILRSRSRFGFTDFGTNARRIRLFSSELMAMAAAMTPPLKVEQHK